MSDSVNINHRPEEKVPVPENQISIGEVQQSLLKAIKQCADDAVESYGEQAGQYARASLDLVEAYRLLGDS